MARSPAIEEYLQLVRGTVGEYQIPPKFGALTRDNEQTPANGRHAASMRAGNQVQANATAFAWG
jgi:hypothetical protein